MFKPVPFAEYEVTSAPAGFSFHLANGELPLVLDPTQDQSIGAECTLRVIAPDGHRNVGRHVIARGSHGWSIFRIGYPIRLNGEWLSSRDSLRDGDRISTGAGVIFTFRLRADLEELEETLIANGWDPRAQEAPVRDFLMEHTQLGVEGTSRALRHFALRRLNEEQV